MLRKSTSFRHGPLIKPEVPLKPGGGGSPMSSKMFGPVSKSSNNPQPPPPSKLPVRNFHHVSTPSWPRYQGINFSEFSFKIAFNLLPILIKTLMRNTFEEIKSTSIFWGIRMCSFFVNLLTKNACLTFAF